MSDSAQVLALKCSPSALSLNFMGIFSTNRRPIEGHRARAGEICKPHQMAKRFRRGRQFAVRGWVRRPAMRSGQSDAAPPALRGCRGRGRMVPHAKSAQEGEVIAAEACVLRQAL